MNRKVRYIMASLVGVMGLTFAGNAFANSSGDDVSMISAQASSSVKTSINYRYIGTWVMASQKLKMKKNGRPKCYWAEGTWTNSVKVPVVRSYRERSRAYFCDLEKPVKINGVTYTAVKMKGGQTDSPCKNLAIPPGRSQPKPQIRGPVLDVRSLDSVTLAVKVDARANASVTGQKNCPGGTLSGSANGSSTLTGTVRLKLSRSLIVKNKGRTDGAVKTAIDLQVKLMVEARAKNNAFANIVIVCGAAPPPPPVIPPPVIPPPTPGTVKLVKYVFVDGNKVATPSGFGFTVNGTGFSNSGEETMAPGTYQTNTSVTVCETNPQGYVRDGEQCQTKTMQAGGLVFVFVNRKTTPPSPPPANRPPTIRLECPAHVYSNPDPNKTGRVVIWAYVADPDGNPLTVGFARPQYGKYNGGSYPDATDSTRFGSEYQAPVWTGPGDLMETITVTVNDGQGKSNSVATASCSFPIKPDDFG